MSRTMDARDVARTLVSESGMTPPQLSRAVRRGRTHCYTILNQSSVPRLDTLVRLANACGYRVVLERVSGERVVPRVPSGGR